MRKWTALLLAVLLALTPMATLADSYLMERTYDLDGEAFAPVLTEVIGLAAQMLGEDVAAEMTGGLDVEALAHAAELLMDATSFTVQYQPDGLRFVCSMREQELGSAFLAWNEQEIALCTTLLPEVKLTLPLEQFYAVAGILAEVDWAAVAQDAAARTAQWAAALSVSEEVGSFGGDAYANGIRRVTYALTDSDIADLLDSLLLGLEANATLTTALTRLFGAEAVNNTLHDFRAYNMEVRLDSAYHYTFSTVYAKHGGVAGFSLNVLEAEEMIASVSLGATDEGDMATLVISIPMGSGVVYLDAQLAIGETLQGSFAVYQSAKLVGYQQAREDAAALIQRQTVELAYTRNDNGHLMEMSTEFTGKLKERTQTIQIVQDHPYAMSQTHTVWLGEGQQPVAITTTTAKTTSATNAFQEGLTSVNLLQLEQDDAACQTLQQAWSKGLQEVMVRLFKALPPEMMTMVLMQQ